MSLHSYCRLARDTHATERKRKKAAAHSLGDVSARGVALAGGQRDAGHEVEGEGRRKAAHEHGIGQQGEGRGVPGHQQVEGEAPQLVDGVPGAQAGVCLQQM